MQPEGKDGLTRPLLGGVARIEDSLKRCPARLTRQAARFDELLQPVLKGDRPASNEIAVSVDC